MSHNLRLLCGLALASMSTAAMAEWTKTNVPAFGFAAAFPGPPEAESTVEDGVKLTSYSAGADGTFCLVVVADYGGTIDPEVEIPASRDNFAKGVKAQITAQKRISFPRGSKGLQAIDFDTASQTHLFRSILVIDGALAYQVAGGVPKDGGRVADLDRCVGGFSLLAN